jgi:hypothetical protein
MRWRQFASDIALMRYPFRPFGIDFGRNVTLIRLADGRLVIHSTAPFAAADIDAIRNFGQPAWLVDATLVHDTFARQGRDAFPDIPYLAPPGFERMSGLPIAPLYPPPFEWADAIVVLPIDGVRQREHVFFHRNSRTLIVADLVFHFPPSTRGWAWFFVRYVMRLPRHRGISLFFRMLIRDRKAFERSMMTVLELDFDRMIVGHDDPIEKDAKAVLKEAMRDRGFRIVE